MIAALHFITLIITTMFAAATAVLVNWLLLRGMFRLMRPATAGRTSAEAAVQVRLHIVPGTALAARAYSGRR
jgi:hypothetical protein